MQIVGVITEHNPFHNGHKYHLEKARELSGAEAVISVMSGNFLQRGEPSLVNKWARCKMALLSGADLVLELPTAFATRSAPAFARGAVETLHHTGVVSHLCFGSEVGTIVPLSELASLLQAEPPALKELIREELSTGVILPLAQKRALEIYLRDNPALAQVAASPNNILGIEYLKALAACRSKIVPLTIQRLVAGYHDKEISPEQEIASATGIRNLVFSGGGLNDPALKKLVPPGTLKILEEEFSEGRGPIGPDNLTLPLYWNLRKSGPQGLKEIIDVLEGLENRLYEQSLTADTFIGLIEKVKTKRYTWTRLQRILLHFLLGYTKKKAAAFDTTGPLYIKVLGFTEKGQQILQDMKKEASLPLILHPAPWVKEPGPLKDMLELDILASDLYALLYPNNYFGGAGRDFREKPVIIQL